MVTTILILLVILLILIFNISSILTFIALILFIVVYVLDEITMMFIEVRNRKWYKITSERKYNKAFKVDVLANWLFPTFWMLVLSKRTSEEYSFGVFGETLSSCLGRKKLEHSLSWVGLAIYYVLYAFDYTKWKKGGHCVAVIMSDKEIKEFLNR